MSTCTTKSWDVTSRGKELKSGFNRGFILLLLTFIWLSSFAETKEKHFNDLEIAATLAAFEGCEDNLLKNGDFQFNDNNWNNSLNSLNGVASNYTTDGNFHVWVLPLTGTGELYQDIPVVFSNQEFSLVVNAGVEDPNGTHLVGLQFMNSGTVLSTSSVEVNNNLNVSGNLQTYTVSAFPPTGTTKVLSLIHI